MRSGELARPVASTVWLMVVVILSSLALSFLVENVPVFLAIGAICALILLIVFLQRPDLGLLIVLFVRALTDLSISYAGWTSVLGRIPSSPLNVGLVLILVFAGGVYLISRGAPFLRLPGGVPFTLLLLTGLISTLRSPSILFSLDQWCRAASALVVYGLAAELFRTRPRVQGVIDVLAASFVIPAGVGFYQLITRHGYFNGAAGVIQIPGTFVHQNAFGFYLVLIFAVFVCQIPAQSGIRKLLASSIVAASGVLLVATFARSVGIAALIVLFAVGALRKRGLLILAPAVAILVLGMVPSFAHRFADPLGGSFADRRGIWQDTSIVWMSKTHDDMGALPTVVNRLIGTGPGSTEILTRTTHNDYLRVLFEYGVLGFVAYLAMLLSVLVSGYRTWRHCTDERMGSIALSFIAVTAGFMVMSLTENIFAGTQNQVYFWTLAGLSAAISQMSVDDSRTGYRLGKRLNWDQAAATIS